MQILFEFLNRLYNNIAVGLHINMGIETFTGAENFT